MGRSSYVVEKKEKGREGGRVRGRQSKLHMNNKGDRDS